MLKDLWGYLCALWKRWVYLLTGGTLTAALVLWERWKAEPISKGIYGVVISFFFFIASFLAWREEHVENRNGPQVVMEWDSPNRPGVHDTIRLRNIGRSSALNVRVGRFSWPELNWHRPIEIQSIHPGQESSREAQFEVTTNNSIGYMRHVLESSTGHRDRLSIEVTFSDVNNTIFKRTFVLRRGDGMSPDVLVDLGSLEMKRS